MPKVSVIMPVYNGEEYIDSAIGSLLTQDFRDFELIVVNDGSTDRSKEVIEAYGDPRIVYIENASNLGLARVRNIGLTHVRGKYIAWLDCDDVSLPGRLQKQVDVLDQNPKIGLCGTWVKTIGKENEEIWCYPTDSRFLRARMLFDDPLATSSIMMRTECVGGEQAGFDLDYPPAEDYELWERISRTWEVTNIPEVLTGYRVHAAQTSVIKAEKQRQSVWAIQERILARLGVVPTEEERQLHLDIGVGWKFLCEQKRVVESEQWLLKLERANRETTVFSPHEFRAVLAERWRAACRGASGLGLQTWRLFNASPIRNWVPPSVNAPFRLFVRSLLKWKC